MLWITLGNIDGTDREIIGIQRPAAESAHTGLGTGCLQRDSG